LRWPPCFTFLDGLDTVNHARSFIRAYRQELKYQAKQNGVALVWRFKPKVFIFPQKRELQTKISEIKAEILKWLFAAVGAQAFVLLGLCSG